MILFSLRKQDCAVPFYTICILLILLWAFSQLLNAVQKHHFKWLYVQFLHPSFGGPMFKRFILCSLTRPVSSPLFWFQKWNLNLFVLRGGKRRLMRFNITDTHSMGWVTTKVVILLGSCWQPCLTSASLTPHPALHPPRDSLFPEVQHESVISQLHNSQRNISIPV